jgi:hypothetical protein
MPLKSEMPAAIAECLSLHAQAMADLGTDRPELDGRVPVDLREKIIRQRAKVSASEGDPDQHRQQVEALNKGLRIVLRRLVPPKPKPPAPPLPVWDDTGKRWVIPGEAAQPCLSLPEPPAKPTPMRRTRWSTDGDCPHGHRFGHDCDAHGECFACSAFDPCYEQFMKIHQKGVPDD